MVTGGLDVVPYIRGVQLILIGYNGYTKGSRFENDKMVRDEIVRATGRVRSHMLRTLPVARTISSRTILSFSNREPLV